jgi:hypothetical protein
MISLLRNRVKTLCIGEQVSDSVQSGTGPLRDDVRASTSAFMCITVPQNTGDYQHMPTVETTVFQ